MVMLPHLYRGVVRRIKSALVKHEVGQGRGGGPQEEGSGKVKAKAWAGI